MDTLMRLDEYTKIGPQTFFRTWLIRIRWARAPVARAAST